VRNGLSETLPGVCRGFPRAGLIQALCWCALGMSSCSKPEVSFELDCQGTEVSHTQTDRDGVVQTEDTTLGTRRHFALIQQTLNSVMCDQWDDHHIHCGVQDRPKSKDKATQKSFEEDFDLNRQNLQVSVEIKRTSLSDHLKIETRSNFSGQCQRTGKR
jgi:hypothetical protein